jgi:hypothetical protein
VPLTRRRFLAVASASAVGSLAGLSTASASQATDLFASSAAFKGEVGSTFSVRLADGRTARAKLSRVRDFRTPSARPNRRVARDTCTGAGFTLAFSGADLRGAPAATYGVTHPRLGAFDLFLSPVGKRAAYEAVINRRR